MGTAAEQELPWLRPIPSPTEWPNAGSGEVWLDGVWIRFSSDSDPNGQVIVEVYDTAGFTYGSLEVDQQEVPTPSKVYRWIPVLACEAGPM